MKNLVLILSLAISLSILSGCSDSDSMDPGLETPPDDIVGFWEMTKIVKDGVDLTDDCTTRSYMSISETNKFSGHDYDFIQSQNDCLLTTFKGEWVYLISNLYTFTIFGHDFTMEIYGDSLRAEFIHAFDGKYYIEEYIRQE